MRFAVTLDKDSHWVISVWQIDANSVSACIPLLLLSVAVTATVAVAVVVGMNKQKVRPLITDGDKSSTGKVFLEDIGSPPLETSTPGSPGNQW